MPAKPPLQILIFADLFEFVRGFRKKPKKDAARTVAKN
jgi:hypothetical protein